MTVVAVCCSCDHRHLYSTLVAAERVPTVTAAILPLLPRDLIWINLQSLPYRSARCRCIDVDGLRPVTDYVVVVAAAAVAVVVVVSTAVAVVVDDAMKETRS